MAVNQSFPTDRRHNGTNPIAPHGHDERSEHDQRSEHEERGEQDLRREHGGYDDRSREEMRREQDQRGEHDQHSEQNQRGGHDERGEQGQRRDHRRRTMFGESGDDRREGSADRTRSATSTSSGDVLGPVLAAWAQAYASMFELAANMMKLQQRTFASMIAAADTNAERTADGEQRGRVLQGVPASRTGSASGHIEHDRR